MEIHWSPEASADFTHIIQYIRQDNVAAALRVGQTIYQRIQKLQSFPKMGRLGRVEGPVNCRFRRFRLLWSIASRKMSLK